MQQVILAGIATLVGCDGGSDPAPSARSGDPRSSATTPAIERVTVEPWPISLEVSRGSTVGPVQNVLGEFVDIETTAGCGADIQIHRQAWSDRTIADQFAAATRQDSEDYSYPLAEQDAEGHRVKVVVANELMTMRGAEVGTRIGAHYYTCTANGGVSPIEESEADCVFEACRALRAAR